MLNVTLFCSSLVRLGPTNVIYNMLEAYYKMQRDVRFTVVTISNEPKDSRKEEFEELGVKVVCCHLAPGYSGFFHKLQIKDAILSTHPNLVHSYGFRADCILHYLNIGKIKKISSIWNNPYEDYPMLFGKLKGWIMARLHLKLLKKFDVVTVCSNFIKNRIAKSNLNPITIYTGVPSDYFIPLPSEERAKCRAAAGIKKEDRMFLFIGNLIPRKNPLYLISVFKHLPPNYHLMIMGDGPLMKQCKEAIGECPNITLLGAQPGTLKHLQLADFYISSSFSEGFPTAVLEAMSIGVMPILSDIAPHVEMIRNLYKEATFSNDDENSVLECIYNISSNTIPASEVRKYLQTNYSAEIMQKRYIDLYYQVSANINLRGGLNSKIPIDKRPSAN